MTTESNLGIPRPPPLRALNPGASCAQRAAVRSGSTIQATENFDLTGSNGAASIDAAIEFVFAEIGTPTTAASATGAAAAAVITAVAIVARIGVRLRAADELGTTPSVPSCQPDSAHARPTWKPLALAPPPPPPRHLEALR